MVRRADKAMMPAKPAPQDWKPKPLPPCACGKPQLCAVRIPGGLKPACEECYRAWWTPERIRERGPQSTNKLVQEIRAAYLQKRGEREPG